MSEEYELVFDYKKIALLIIGIIAVMLVVFIIISGELPSFLPEIKIPEIQLEPIQNEPVITNGVLVEYQKYIDFGLSIDDIMDIQNLDCSLFVNATTLSTDPKFTNIFDQRRLDCGL